MARPFEFLLSLIYNRLILAPPKLLFLGSERYSVVNSIPIIGFGLVIFGMVVLLHLVAYHIIDRDKQNH